MIEQIVYLVGAAFVVGFGFIIGAAVAGGVLDIIRQWSP